MNERRSERRRKPFHHRQELRFQCTGCGVCCRGGDEHYVFLERAEALRICAYLGLSWRWFRRRYLARHPDGDLVLRMRDDGACTFLGDDAGCRIYSVRPWQCVSYPFWPEVVATAQAWYQEARRCEGIGRGRVLSLATIELYLRGDDEDG